MQVTYGGKRLIRTNIAGQQEDDEGSQTWYSDNRTEKYNITFSSENLKRAVSASALAVEFLSVLDGSKLSSTTTIPYIRLLQTDRARCTHHSISRHVPSGWVVRIPN
jgi:hypothetical protein